MRCYKTFFFLSPCDSNWKQTWVPSCQLKVFAWAHAAVRAPACGCSRTTHLDMITSWTAAIQVLKGAEGLIPFSKTLWLLSNGNLFHKSFSCGGEEWPFPSPHLEIPASPPENTGLCEAEEMAGEESGSLAVYGAAREAARTLLLTALLSEPHTTISLLHLELWHVSAMPWSPEMCRETWALVTVLPALCKQLLQVEMCGPETEAK